MEDPVTLLMRAIQEIAIRCIDERLDRRSIEESCRKVLEDEVVHRLASLVPAELEKGGAREIVEQQTQTQLRRMAQETQANLLLSAQEALGQIAKNSLRAESAKIVEEATSNLTDITSKMVASRVGGIVEEKLKHTREYVVDPKLAQFRSDIDNQAALAATKFAAQQSTLDQYEKRSTRTTAALAIFLPLVLGASGVSMWTLWEGIWSEYQGLYETRAKFSDYRAKLDRKLVEVEAIRASLTDELKRARSERTSLRTELLQSIDHMDQQSTARLAMFLDTTQRETDNLRSRVSVLGEQSDDAQTKLRDHSSRLDRSRGDLNSLESRVVYADIDRAKLRCRGEQLAIESTLPQPIELERGKISVVRLPVEGHSRPVPVSLQYVEFKDASDPKKASIHVKAWHDENEAPLVPNRLHFGTIEKLLVDDRDTGLVVRVDTFERQRSEAFFPRILSKLGINGPETVRLRVWRPPSTSQQLASCTEPILGTAGEHFNHGAKLAEERARDGRRSAAIPPEEWRKAIATAKNL